MPSEISKTQPVRDLVEFTFVAYPVEGSENTFDLKAELRVGAAEIDESAHSEAFTVLLKRIFIELDCSGANIVPGSKFGEPIESNELKIRTEIKKKVNLHVSADGEISGQAGSKNAAEAHAEASAKLAASKDYDCVQSSEQETSKMRVKAIGNDRWEVTQINGSTLDGKILNHQSLCQVITDQRSNAALIVGRALAKQKDFKFPGTSTWLKKLSNTDQKLLNVFLTKKLAEGEYSGEIPLASLEIDLKS